MLNGCAYILTVDVGNTFIRFGLFAEDSAAAQERPLATCEITTPARITADEVRMRLAQVMAALAADAGMPGALVPAAAVLSCVVPALERPWKAALSRTCTGRVLTVVPGKPILEVRDLVTRFPLRSGIFNRLKREVHAVENVSFDLWPGETLALVGESGCGKSTTGRALLRLVETQEGTITFNGERIDTLPDNKLQAVRRDIQFIFQDPYASLDPRHTVGYSIMEPLRVHNLLDGEAAQRRVAWLLERVGLKPEHAWRYPHEFSGGQRQRICIARALALNPKVVIADESVSALDVSIRAQIINLLLDLQRDMGIAFLFISHDMAVVERISHRVAVMFMGQIVEIGPRRAVFENPQHPYTRKLIAAVPVADPAHRHGQRVLLQDEMPSNIRKRGEAVERVTLREVGPGHFVAPPRQDNAFSRL